MSGCSLQLRKVSPAQSWAQRLSASKVIPRHWSTTIRPEKSFEFYVRARMRSGHVRDARTCLWKSMGLVGGTDSSAIVSGETPLQTSEFAEAMMTF